MEHLALSVFVVVLMSCLIEKLQSQFGSKKSTASYPRLEIFIVAFQSAIIHLIEWKTSTCKMNYFNEVPIKGKNRLNEKTSKRNKSDFSLTQNSTDFLQQSPVLAGHEERQDAVPITSLKMIQSTKSVGLHRLTFNAFFKLMDFQRLSCPSCTEQYQR